MKQHDLILLQNKVDELLEREGDLFSIIHYPLFDKELALDVLADEATVQEIIKEFQEDIVKDLINIKEIYKKRDWDKIQKRVDYMVDSASFGTVRLYFSLLLLEKYLAAGENQYKEALYTQMIGILDETLTELTSKGLHSV
jgi:two-component system, OmpR family, aerobic respiration control sensor histidine kinase ArcB